MHMQSATIDSNLDGITDDLFVNVTIPLNANEIVTQITAVLLFAVAVSVIERVCTAFLCPAGVFKCSIPDQSCMTRVE